MNSYMMCVCVAVEFIFICSEVQVYYKDDGKIALKVDVCMNPELSIKVAHSLAGDLLCFIK